MQLRPGPPGIDGGVESLPQLLLGPRPRRRLAERGPVQPEQHLLTGDEPERARRAARAAVQLLRAGEHQLVGAAATTDPAVDRGQQRTDPAVLRSRGELDDDLDLAGGTHRMPDEQVRCTAPELVTGVVLTHRERIGDHQGAARDLVRRLQNECAVKVAAIDVCLSDRPQRPRLSRVS
jgi:hypothetical protein